jgi:hypothetical protein
LSKRKRGPSEERRREQVELNLLSQNQERRSLAKARRGCTLPFLGGTLLVLAFEVARAGLS